MRQQSDRADVALHNVSVLYLDNFSRRSSGSLYASSDRGRSWTRVAEDLGQITRVLILPQRVGLDASRFSVSAEG